MVKKEQLSIGLRLEAWVWVTPIDVQWIPAEVVDIYKSEPKELVLVKIYYPGDSRNYTVLKHVKNLRLIGEQQ